MKTNYDRFWELLLAGLAASNDPTGSIEAIDRLRRIEVGPSGQGGQTGYVNGVDPPQAAIEYLAHILRGGPAPLWLKNAERGG